SPPSSAALGKTSPRYCELRCPAFRARYRLGPAGRQLRRLIARHGRREATIDLAVGGDLFDIAPVSDCKPGEIRRAQGCRFEYFRSDHRDAEQIGLELHQQIVGRGAAIDAKFGDLE